MKRSDPALPSAGDPHDPEQAPAGGGDRVLGQRGGGAVQVPAVFLPGRGGHQREWRK